MDKAKAGKWVIFDGPDRRSRQTELKNIYTSLTHISGVHFTFSSSDFNIESKSNLYLLEYKCVMIHEFMDVMLNYTTPVSLFSAFPRHVMDTHGAPTSAIDVYKLHIAQQHVSDGYKSVGVTITLHGPSWETEINCLFGCVSLSVRQQNEGIPWEQMWANHYGIWENDTWNGTQNETSMKYVESFVTCTTSKLNYLVPNHSFLIIYSFKQQSHNNVSIVLQPSKCTSIPFESIKPSVFDSKYDSTIVVHYNDPDRGIAKFRAHPKQLLLRPVYKHH